MRLFLKRLTNLRIGISTGTNRLFSDAKFIEFLIVLSLIAIVIIIFKDGYKEAQKVMPDFKAISEDANFFVSVVLTIGFILFSLRLVIFVINILRPIGEFIIYIIIEPLFGPWVYLFFLKKIWVDITNSKVRGFDKISSSVKDAIADVEKLRKISLSKNNNWLDNTNIWDIEYSSFNQDILEELDCSSPLSLKELRKKYKIQIQNLKTIETELEDDERIEFMVASVQPAFFMLMKRVVRKAKIKERCLITADTLTGPSTVEKCVKIYKNRANVSSPPNSIISFVAPLSAFSTFEAYNAKKPIVPTRFFSPFITLSHEVQTLFYAEGKTSLPRGRNHVFYLNNSTAEECAALLCEQLKQKFEPYPVSTYDDYRLLLNGGVIDEGRKIEAGDGIILWSPLSEYYQFREVHKLYLLGLNQATRFNFKNFVNSKIMLFGEKDLSRFSPSLQGFYKSLMLAFIYRVALANVKLVNSKDKVKLRSKVRYFFKYSLAFFSNHFRRAFSELFIKIS